MARLRTLKGLPFNLAHSYFSCPNYYKKGYMSDWIVNSSLELNINYLEIDIINETVSPNELQIKPLQVYLVYAKNIIKKYLSSNGFDEDFIKVAKLEVKVKEGRVIICNCVIKTMTDRVFRSKDYVEQSYEIFNVMNPPLLEILKDKYSEIKNRIKIYLFKNPKINVKKIKYTKRVEKKLL